LLVIATESELDVAVTYSS